MKICVDREFGAAVLANVTKPRLLLCFTGSSLMLCVPRFFWIAGIAVHAALRHEVRDDAEEARRRRRSRSSPGCRNDRRRAAPRRASPGSRTDRRWCRTSPCRSRAPVSVSDAGFFSDGCLGGAATGSATDRRSMQELSVHGSSESSSTGIGAYYRREAGVDGKRDVEDLPDGLAAGSSGANGFDSSVASLRSSGVTTSAA